MTEPSETYVLYYNWEGDACRLVQHPDGSMSADLYRGGKGLLPIDIADVLFGAKRISEDMYKELVLEEIARTHHKGAAG